MNGAKKNIKLVAVIAFCLACACTAFAQNYLPEGNKIYVPVLQTHEHVVDLGKLLSAEEKNYLEAKIDEIVKRQNFDVVVLTVDSLNGLSREAYADDFYDYNNYGMDEDGNGYGVDRDGVLLLVKMAGGQGNRDIHISTRGFGIEAFTYHSYNWILDRLIPLLVQGEYAGAFDKFASYADEFVTQARVKPYSGNRMPEKEPFNNVMWIFISLFVATIVSVIVFIVNKAKLKSVEQKTTATGYERQGSMKITNSSERFLYRDVSRSYSPQQKQNSGGSHTSSSGASHGGGGRSF